MTLQLIAPPREGEDFSIVKSIRWKPNKVGKSLRESIIICVLTSDGWIKHWNLGTNKLINESSYHKEIGNNIYCADYTCDGFKMLVAGSDRNIYQYDEKSRELEAVLHTRDHRVSGHVNRVYSIKTHPNDPNIFCTAGWDGSVKIYAINMGGPVGSVRGPEICADSLTMHGDILLSASYRNSQCMQMFSTIEQRCIFTFEFNQMSTVSESGYCMTARFSHCGNFIFSGGAGKNELKVFANNCDSLVPNFKILMELKDLPASVVSMDTNPQLDQFFFGLENGCLYMVQYENDNESPDFEAYKGEFEKVAERITQKQDKQEAQKVKGGTKQFFGEQYI